MNKLTLIFRILLGIACITILLYIRLLPRVSRDLWENMTHRQLFLILLTISLILLNIYSILKSLGYIKSNPNPWVTQVNEAIKKFFQFFIDNLVLLYGGIWFVIEYLAKRYFHTSYVYYNSMRKFLLFSNKEKYLKFYAIVLLSLRYVPRIIFLCALITDVFIYKHFDYTFRCIPLLLLILIPGFIIFALKHYYDQFSESVYFLLQKRYMPETNDYRYSYKPEFQVNQPTYVKDFYDYFDHHYKVINRLKINVERYETFLETLKTDYLLLFIACCRLLVYVYILIYGLS